ncbi:MAG TPA: hypothetical protein QF683_13290 [SAR324 cluster bacterium]|nr:hypothetical protein [SAR324 cluster bacterium]MDP7332133.1 hypothetical protein [SAR324 cluster bacterium]HJO45613.1 hypothetical protein [SAR324 cluster bacterium]
MCSKRLQIFTPYHPPFRHLTQGERKNANLGAKKNVIARRAKHFDAIHGAPLVRHTRGAPT